MCCEKVSADSRQNEIPRLMFTVIYFNVQAKFDAIFKTQTKLIETDDQSDSNQH